MADPTCSIPGCSTVVKPGQRLTRGWCPKHYQRWRKYGSTELPTREAGELPAPRGAECFVCGEATTMPISRALPTTKHKKCFEHGQEYAYSKHGCRCAACREPKAEASRAYTERRRVEGKPICPSRPTRPAICVFCGTRFEARVQNGEVAQRACSAICVSRKGRPAPEVPAFRVAREVRLAIYEASDWKCQLCGDGMSRRYDPADPWSPTLDHIVPRSHGGSDDPENLRASHAWCNTVRGDGRYDDSEFRGGTPDDRSQGSPERAA